MASCQEIHPRCRGAWRGVEEECLVASGWKTAAAASRLLWPTAKRLWALMFGVMVAGNRHHRRAHDRTVPLRKIPSSPPVCLRYRSGSEKLLEKVFLLHGIKEAPSGRDQLLMIPSQGAAGTSAASELSFFFSSMTMKQEVESGRPEAAAAPRRIIRLRQELLGEPSQVRDLLKDLHTEWTSQLYPQTFCTFFFRTPLRSLRRLQSRDASLTWRSSRGS